MSQRLQIEAVVMMSEVILLALRSRAARKTEPHEEDDKWLDLEAVELIERLLKIVKADVVGQIGQTLRPREQRHDRAGH